MARAVVGKKTTSDVRAELIEHARGNVARHRPRVDAGDGGFFISPWPRLLADLEAGDTVILSRWQLPPQFRARGAAFSRYELGADDQLRRVAR